MSKSKPTIPMDQYLWMKALHFHGPLLLQTVLGEDQELKHELKNKKLNEKLSMCKFIRDKLHFLFKPCDNTSFQLPDQTIPRVPIELFHNYPHKDRRDLFYKTLDRGNIIMLRVINNTLPDNYKLLALCRDEICMKLDDLSIVMYLPKLKAELDLVGGKLVVNDLIRAAVCSCSIDERKLYVTLDSTVLEDEAENVKLGKISESDLPFYFGNVDIGSSYVEYLHHKPEFNNPNWSEDLYTVLNLDKYYHYSFIDALDGKTYPPEVCGPELLKKQTLVISNKQYDKAQRHYKSGKFQDAIICLNYALSIYPKNVEALVSRGILHANTNSLRKAFVDVEEALKIEPTHLGARHQMSVLLTSAARLHIEQNDMDKAKESLDAALNLDSGNQEAIATIEEIRKKESSSDKTDGSEKKNRIWSSSSIDSRDSSTSSKVDDQRISLEASTRAFLSSMRKQYSKKSHRRHHHKDKSKSPKKPLP